MLRLALRLEFCTLLDLRYLARGLVLYRSLRTLHHEARVRVFCMDREAKWALDELALPGLVATGLEELEEYAPELRSVKKTRSWLEYLWTATPAHASSRWTTRPRLRRWFDWMPTSSSSPTPRSCWTSWVTGPSY